MKEIYTQLKKQFKHPGVLLFRGRELPVVKRFFEKNNLPGSKKMLDIGCGEGNVGAMLFKKVDVGLEPVESDAKKASNNGVYKEVVVGDARRMTFEDASFDIVFSNSVLEHISGIDLVLDEINRILKPSGDFIFTCPSKYFSQYLFFSLLPGGLYAKFRNMQLSHYNLLSSEEWETKLKKFGFKVYYSEYYLPKSEILVWDFICVTLKLTSFIPSLHKYLEKKYFEKVEELLNYEYTASLKNGGSVLIAARKS